MNYSDLMLTIMSFWHKCDLRKQKKLSVMSIILLIFVNFGYTD